MKIRTDSRKFDLEDEAPINKELVGKVGEQYQWHTANGIHYVVIGGYRYGKEGDSWIQNTQQLEV